MLCEALQKIIVTAKLEYEEEISNKKVHNEGN